MNQMIIDSGLAVWLGILTAISPCPLTTNIIAISYIGKQVKGRGYVLAEGLAYGFGRMLTYAVLGFFLVASTQSVPKLSYFLQTTLSLWIGPVLILVGLFILRIVRLPFGGNWISESTQSVLSRKGIWGALLLGILFALSFCPVSAALFFGNILALAVKHQSRFVIPALYGIGSALPVILFAILIALSVRGLGIALNKLSVFEKWARRISGGLFLIIGLYWVIKYFLSGL
jgi:cytochrome c-type biogenesis protein